MPWSAYTNGGVMQTGVVLAIIQTPQVADSIPQPPPSDVTIGVWLTYSGNPQSSTVAFGWVDDAVYKLPGDAF